MLQVWHDLLFAHWPIPAETMREHVPAQLSLDMLDGQCWIGVVPFHMSGVRPRWLPALPGLSRFPELNVRTYVTVGGKAGVYFFSLDAANLVAVLAARLSYRLPYFWARMETHTTNNEVTYSSIRKVGNASFAGNYRPTAPPEQPQRNSLEHWLTERYRLYTVHGGECTSATFITFPGHCRPPRLSFVRTAWPMRPASHFPIAHPCFTFPVGRRYSSGP